MCVCVCVWVIRTAILDIIVSFHFIILISSSSSSSSSSYSPPPPSLSRAPQSDFRLIKRFFFLWLAIVWGFTTISRQQTTAIFNIFFIIFSFGFSNRRRCSSFTMRAFPIPRRSTFFFFSICAHLYLTVSGGCGWDAVLSYIYIV